MTDLLLGWLQAQDPLALYGSALATALGIGKLAAYIKSNRDKRVRLTFESEHVLHLKEGSREASSRMTYIRVIHHGQLPITIEEIGYGSVRGTLSVDSVTGPLPVTLDQRSRTIDVCLKQPLSTERPGRPEYIFAISDLGKIYKKSVKKCLKKDCGPRRSRKT